MMRFAILTHDHPFLHWDLLLEDGPACRTWRLLAEPAPGQTVAAQSLPNHRLHYLEYQGRVGGGRGTVTQWDTGTYATRVDLGQPDAATGVCVTLSGQRLRGRCVLVRHANGDWSATFSAGPSAHCAARHG